MNFKSRARTDFNNTQGNIIMALYIYKVFNCKLIKLFIYQVESAGF